MLVGDSGIEPRPRDLRPRPGRSSRARIPPSAFFPSSPRADWLKLMRVTPRELFLCLIGWRGSVPANEKRRGAGGRRNGGGTFAAWRERLPVLAPSGSAAAAARGRSVAGRIAGAARAAAGPHRLPSAPFGSYRLLRCSSGSGISVSPSPASPSGRQHGGAGGRAGGRRTAGSAARLPRFSGR